MTSQIDRLLHIMRTLRHPTEGCEWDLAQTFQTIVPHTIEEAYEVADAVERNDLEDLRSELGDLLFQVVFQSRIAEEAGHFNFEDVARAMSDKLEARHPHIFGDEELPGGMREERWEALKAKERAAEGSQSAIDGVATALPALIRAQKLQKRAARVGFDWPDIEGPRAKVFEEIEELESATSQTHREEEAGDLLFAIVNYLRAHDIAAEDALRAANSKFERRFRGMEELAQGTFEQLDLDAQEALWQQVKSRE
ncbi:Nucleoside triphosphate pyrophosphohydrolase MazG [Altererythrobacter epoxidivorans]|uniref:Nucleoside triphosphate pyrophosphohydrolase MazG n=1 Tax=Altererythrobacter epoxidivorans TaxID=361183 RepID=A0A0M4MGI7_9SPHN|nr:nucleoside triphosphate pyrophosphohydrolase [Altererythrobacter epoxidivorans]ALE16480.1 Nucleoside triphosphate pyrophosphohydrolase MazG [Altererythrobacter epoxidivorans]